MDELNEFLDRVKRDVDSALDRLVPASEVVPQRLHQAIRWSLFAGGKRIRPALVFAAGNTFGASPRDLTAQPPLLR